MKTLLVVVYLSHTGLLDMKDYPVADMATCQSKAQAIRANVKAGKISTACFKIGETYGRQKAS
jgi:hypothetical protein